MEKSTFTIYNASAGSGKTFTLVKEYLILLVRSKRTDAYKQILAVTFTNKAVAEMKRRIVEGLYAFAQKECPPKFTGLKALVAEETGLLSEEITKRSEAILKSIIHNYASFEVSTIDGFTHRVLRTFAKDLGLPLNFEVELNASDVLQEAVDRVIAKAGEDDLLTEVLVSFALGKADEDMSWDIARDLYSISELLIKETEQPFLKQLKDKKLEEFQKLRKSLRNHINTLEEETVETAKAFFELLEQHGIDEEDFNGRYCPKFFLKLKTKDFAVQFDAGWQKNLADLPLYPKRVDSGKQRIMDGLQPGIVHLYESAKQRLCDREFLQAVLRNLVPLSLLSSIQKEMELIKQERAIVLISDFNATISATVKDQPAPFIYERLGERYRNYFIDEFQDTSQMQWENLIPLIDHALSSAYDDQSGSLTLVGDAKQSIYRWRGGKAEQFIDLCKEKNPFNIEEKEVVVLPKNYRSTRTIVDFNNDFFSYASGVFSREDHSHLFKHSSFQEPANEDGGYVNISFIEAENAQEELQVYPQKVFEIVENLEEKGIPKSNICILTRTGKEGVAIANYLSERGVAIISYQSLLVERSPKVTFLIAVLRFSIEGRDKLLKLSMLEYLLEFQLKEEETYGFISDRLDLEAQKFFDSLLGTGYDFSLEELAGYSVYEAVEYIIRSFDLMEESDAYVQFFLDFVYEASQKESAGIFQFLELWDQKKDILSIVAPKSEDAVQILTIHKAKGLEFPIVIYPFANGKIEDVARESLWLSLPKSVSEELPVGYFNANKKMLNWGPEATERYEELCCQSQLDALNVLYVALTRPVQQLYVVSKMELDKKGMENPNRISGLLIGYLKEKGRWDGSAEYGFGKISDFIPEDLADASSLALGRFYSAPTESQGLSIITRAGLLWDSQQKEAIERGQLIHDLFAQIHSFDDLDTVIAASQMQGMIQEKEGKEIRGLLESVMTHPQLRHCYSGSAISINERDILTGTGAVLRPDRLNFTGNQVSIIDYKTGMPLPQHQSQIQGYAEVLSDMGYEVYQKFLVYINEEVNVTSV